MRAAAGPQRKEIAVGKEDRLKKVFICSPCRPRGETPKARERDWIGNINRARQACRYALDQGKIPYAPHLYFTTILSEADEDERELGILLGLVWLSQCDELWIIGRRITEGMKREIAQAEAWNIKVVHYIPERTAEERLLDAIFHPEIKYKEMT